MHYLHMKTFVVSAIGVSLSPRMRDSIGNCGKIL